MRGPRATQRSEQVILGSAYAGTNGERASLDTHTQEPCRIGPEDVAARRFGNARCALYELDRLPFAERVVGAEHDVAGVDLVGEALQQVGIEHDALVVERPEICAEVGPETLGSAAADHPVEAAGVVWN